MPIENRLVALGTWRLAHFIFSLFANTVRTPGPIGLGETIIDVLRHREYDCASWQAIGGTWHMPIAIGTILIFSFFANNVRTASPIPIGRGTDRCVSTSGRWWCLLGIDRWHLAHADWHSPHFKPFSRITSERLVRSEWERHWSMCLDLGKMVVPVENHGARAPLSCNKFHYWNCKHAYTTILAPRQCLAMPASSF